MNTRRRTERYAFSGLAKIQSRMMGALPRECRVTDISDGGVRLHAEGMEVPDEFFLHLNNAGPVRRECRVVWRLGFEVGAEFTDQAQQGFGRRFAGRERQAG